MADYESRNLLGRDPREMHYLVDIVVKVLRGNAMDALLPKRVILAEDSNVIYRCSQYLIRALAYAQMTPILTENFWSRQLTSASSATDSTTVSFGLDNQKYSVETLGEHPRRALCSRRPLHAAQTDGLSGEPNLHQLL